MEQEVLEKLKTKLATISEKNVATISDNTKLKEDLNLASLEMSKIISEFEEEYDTFIKYTELMHATTVSEAAKVIAKFCE
ncbi:MAG: acyl carrier protein [Bacilli bacterium]|nr:acyl carrier protein [Bacilli bacterium]